MPLFKSKAAKKGETATATAVTTPNHFLTPQRIMLAQLPIFGGTKNESFNNFSHQIELQMNNYANNDENKLETMLLRLHGTAATSFIELITQNPSITFDEMKAAMKRQFPEPLNTSLHVLRKRKQYRNETLDEFADAIKSLVNKFFTNSRGYNERARNFQMIKYFAANLQQPIKQQLKKYVKSFKEMNEALLKAKQLQQSHQSHQRQRMTAQMSQLHLNQQQMTQPQNTQFFSREQQSIKPQSNSSLQMHHRQLQSNASREHQWQQRQPCQRENKNWQGRQF